MTTNKEAWESAWEHKCPVQADIIRVSEGLEGFPRIIALGCRDAFQAGYLAAQAAREQSDRAAAEQADWKAIESWCRAVQSARVYTVAGTELSACVSLYDCGLLRSQVGAGLNERISRAEAVHAAAEWCRTND